MKIAIIQPNYLPWIGYFHIINYVDKFIFYDDVQYTKNDWRNRNQIIFDGKKKWLTLPVGISIHRNINEIFIEPEWLKDHLNKLNTYYKNSRFYNEVINLIEIAYDFNDPILLSELNINIIKSICEYLEIKTIFYKSSELNIQSERDKNEKIILFCKKLNCQTYVSGPNASSYIDIEKFKVKNIQLEWFNYPCYHENCVSIIDTLFIYGKRSKDLFNAK